MVSLGTIFLLVTGVTLSPVSVEADLKQNDLPSDLIVVKQARELIAQYGNEVWPGFGDNLAPVLLRSGENEYLLGHSEPPAGFDQVKGEPNLHVKKNHLKAKFDLTTSLIEGIWTIVIPTKDELIEFLRDERESPRFQLNKIDYLRLLINESFKTFQLRTLGNKESNSVDSVACTVKQDLGNEKRRINKLGKLLSRAIEVEKLANVRGLTAQGLKISQKNSKEFTPKIRSCEKEIERSEGTARYIEMRLLMEASRNAARKDAEIDFPSQINIRTNFLSKLTSELSGPTPVRDRLAAMGAAKAMILERLFPGWKKDFFSHSRSLDKMLKTGTSVPEPLMDFPITSVKLNEKPLIVGLANNPSRKSRGLQHVADLEPLDGMVFPFTEETKSAFWMKDTKISLQIGFFGSDGKLLDSVTMDPCSSDDCPSYAPNQHFKYVLELPADSEIQLDKLSRQTDQLVLSTTE